MLYQALTQPASIGRVLDNGFKLFVSSLKPILLLVAITASINVIMQYALFQAMLPAQQVTTEEELAAQMLDMMPQILAISLIMWVISIILYNAILSVVGNVHQGGSGDLYDALMVGIRKMLPVFIAALLYTVAVSIGMLLLLIPGLILMITLLFFQVLIVVDDEGIIASLKRSHTLVWGNYWRTTAVILVPVFIVYALIMVVAIVGGIFGAGGDFETMDATMQMSFGVFDIVLAVVSVLIVPFLDAVFVVHVGDLKLRKSGSDLEQRMAD